MSAPGGMNSLAVPSTPLTPDQYKNYAETDPGFLNLQNSLKANEDAYRASLRGGLNAGAINLGVVPTDPSLSGYLDPSTAAAAAANPLSTNAQLNTQHVNNSRDYMNRAAARGMVDSGETPWFFQNENMRDTQAHADAMSKFMTYANGLFGNLGSLQAANASQLGTELGNAAMRQLALHPGTTTSAVWDDSRGAYVDSQGNLYDQYGNHITTAGGPPPTNFGPSTQAAYAPTPNVNWAPVPNQGSATDNAFFVGPQGYTPPPEQPILTRGGAGPNVRTY